MFLELIFFIIILDSHNVAYFPIFVLVVYFLFRSTLFPLSYFLFCNILIMNIRKLKFISKQSFLKVPELFDLNQYSLYCLQVVIITSSIKFKVNFRFLFYNYFFNLSKYLNFFPLNVLIMTLNLFILVLFILTCSLLSASVLRKKITISI